MGFRNSKRVRRGLVAVGAVAAISLAGVVHTETAPRPRTVRASIDYWAGRYGVDVHLVRAVAWQESGYRPDVVSSTGARGVMQVEPGTFRDTERLLGTRVGRTTDGNVRIGVAYLRRLLREFHGNRRLALAAYYEGPHAVRRRGVAPAADRYVANVLALRDRL